MTSKVECDFLLRERLDCGERSRAAIEHERVRAHFAPKLVRCLGQLLERLLAVLDERRLVLFKRRRLHVLQLVGAVAHATLGAPIEKLRRVGVRLHNQAKVGHCFVALRAKEHNVAERLFGAQPSEHKLAQNSTDKILQSFATNIFFIWKLI